MTPPRRLDPLPDPSTSADVERALQVCTTEYGVIGSRLILLQGWAERVTGQQD